MSAATGWTEQADVVIVEGMVEYLVTDVDLASRLIDEWRVKYGRMELNPATDGPFRLQPRTARG